MELAPETRQRVIDTFNMSVIARAPRALEHHSGGGHGCHESGEWNATKTPYAFFTFMRAQFSLCFLPRQGKAGQAGSARCAVSNHFIGEEEQLLMSEKSYDVVDEVEFVSLGSFQEIGVLPGGIGVPDLEEDEDVDYWEIVTSELQCSSGIISPLQREAPEAGQAVVETTSTARPPPVVVARPRRLMRLFRRSLCMCIDDDMTHAG